MRQRSVFYSSQAHAPTRRRPRTLVSAAVERKAASLPASLVSIQWLRAIAALAVLVFHAVEKLPGQGLIAGIAVALPGAAGVDVFFCVSGFIMWITASQRDISPLKFLRARAIRILPLYWLLTTVLLVAALLLPQAFGRLVLRPDHIATSYLLIPDRSPTDGLIAPLLVQGWTLAYEALFYLLFALCLMVGKARRLPLLATLLIGAVAIGVALRPTTPVWIVYTNPLLLEFLVGVGIAELWRQGRLTLSRLQATTLAVMALAALAATAPLGAETIDQWRVLVWGVPAALIVVAGVAREADAQHWPRVGVVIGDASYAIYLLQGFVVAVAAKLMAPLLTSTAGAMVFFVAVVIATIVAGHLCYRFIERPMTVALRARQPRVNT